MKRLLTLAALLLTSHALAQNGDVDMEQPGIRCYAMKAAADIDSSVFSKKMGTMFLDSEGKAVLKLKVIPNHPGVFSMGTPPSSKQMKTLAEKQYTSGERFILYTKSVLTPDSADQQIVLDYVVSATEECAVIVSCHYPLEMQLLFEEAVRRVAESARIK